MRVDLFDYSLPEELIAQQPVEPRDACRMLVVDRQAGTIEHAYFYQLPHYLKGTDCLVLNDTKVVPARLRGVRTLTGGRWEALFLKAQGDDWLLMAKTRGRPNPGETIEVHGPSGTFLLELRAKQTDGTWVARPVDGGNAFELLTQFGTVPIPPYIRGGRADEHDQSWYQTVFAARPGAVAAPTAGLHFTDDLLAKLMNSGIRRTHVTLHVGPGTFQPVSVEDTDDHHMHSEWCELDEAAAAQLNEVRRNGGRAVAVGTTAVRVLESAASSDGLHAYRGETALFIVPPYQFQATDVLITNFHLPKSTLLMLVCAFGGTSLILEAYRQAVQERYRFYSYGDAMLIL